MNTLLIVDDNKKVYESLAQNFVQRGYRTLHASNQARALELLNNQQITAILLDIMLGSENGLDILRRIRIAHQNVPVIMITGYATIDSAVESIKLGAYDYVQKPLEFDKLLNLVEKAAAYASLSEEKELLKDRLQEKYPRIITKNQKYLTLLRRAKKIAGTELPVLILGDNGTGKEILADYIHLNSARSSRKVQKINCAAFTESLLDNELFGHEKGAYTGAETVFKGIFERAHRSSLLLDEIGDMPRSIQAKILRTMQNKEIRRLGGEKTFTVDVRFIAATNKNLEELVREGRFREDLYYRLNAAMLRIPALRDRKEDIAFLTEEFLLEYASANSIKPKEMSQGVVAQLINHDWPGNIRELKNAVFYAAAISSGQTIFPEDLPPNLMDMPGSAKPINEREELERNLIITMLQKANNNKRKAAKLLNFSRKTLYNKLNKYDINT